MKNSVELCQWLELLLSMPFSSCQSGMQGKQELNMQVVLRDKSFNLFSSTFLSSLRIGHFKNVSVGRTGIRPISSVGHGENRETGFESYLSQLLLHNK